MVRRSQHHSNRKASRMRSRRNKLKMTSGRRQTKSRSRMAPCCDCAPVFIDSPLHQPFRYFRTDSTRAVTYLRTCTTPYSVAHPRAAPGSDNSSSSRRAREIPHAQGAWQPCRPRDRIPSPGGFSGTRSSRSAIGTAARRPPGGYDAIWLAHEANSSRTRVRSMALSRPLGHNA